MAVISFNSPVVEKNKKIKDESIVQIEVESSDDEIFNKERLLKEIEKREKYLEEKEEELNRIEERIRKKNEKLKLVIEAMIKKDEELKKKGAI